MKIAEVIDELGILPFVLEDELKRLTDSELRQRQKQGYFSLMEQVCHLRDIEVEGYTRRLQLLLAEDHPKLHDLDGTALAKVRDYNAQPFLPALTAFQAARHANLLRLERMHERDLARRGHLEKVGEISIGRLLDLWVAHDREHMKEIEDLLQALREPITAQPQPPLSLRT
ncbi:MAG TPA: DinB family protein [Gammaproteobacteria bacterium]